MQHSQFVVEQSRAAAQSEPLLRARGSQRLRNDSQQTRAILVQHVYFKSNTGATLVGVHEFMLHAGGNFRAQIECCWVGRCTQANTCL
jgi:hypothetical protein